jgi:hypothetical protein
MSLLNSQGRDVIENIYMYLVMKENKYYDDDNSCKLFDGNYNFKYKDSELKIRIKDVDDFIKDYSRFFKCKYSLKV